MGLGDLLVQPHPKTMRAFVVGNGPSLNRTNLDLMCGEISFATNRIAKIYPKTKWRPTHYVRAEEASLNAPETYVGDMRTHIIDLECEVWANVWFAKALAAKEWDGKIHTLWACDHYLTNFDEEKAPHVWHLPMLCTFGSSVNVAVQIAVQQGYSPIYLVGCDLGYRDSGNNHFASDYEVGLNDIKPARYANMNILAAHMVAARSSPAPIYNATIGGSLEAYPRVDYEGLFNGQS